MSGINLSNQCHQATATTSTTSAVQVPRGILEFVADPASPAIVRASAGQHDGYDYAVIIAPYYWKLGELEVKRHFFDIADPLSRLLIEKGGAGDGRIFFSDPEQPEWTVFTFDEKVLERGPLLQQPHTRNQIRSMRSGRPRVRWPGRVDAPAVRRHWSFPRR